MLTIDDLQVGKTYRGKRFQQTPWGNNDRRIVWLGKSLFSSGKTEYVQYDSDTVKMGRKLPTVSVEQFLKWAKEEVKPA